MTSIAETEPKGKPKSNGLRMPIAEWLYRMSEAGLSHGKRIVAIYAAAFDITGNSDLEFLTGLSSRTLDKIKQDLPKEGWIIIPPVRGGRGILMRVFPAFRETPVTFTDVSPRNPRKFYPRNPDIPPQELPPYLVQTPAEFTPVSVETPEAVAEVYPRALALIESSLREDSYILEAVSEEKKEGGACAPSPRDALAAFEAYNELAQRVGLPIAQTLTPERRKAIQRRLRDNGGESWASLLSNIERSAFLQGENDRGWRVPGLDWLLKPANFVKVIEGTYGNGAHAKPKETLTERTFRFCQEAGERLQLKGSAGQ